MCNFCRGLAELIDGELALHPCDDTHKPPGRRGRCNRCEQWWPCDWAATLLDLREYVGLCPHVTTPD